PRAAAVGVGGRRAAGVGRPRRKDDPHRPGAEAGRRHGPLRRAAFRPHRLARGPELARMSAALAIEGATVRRGGRLVLEDASLTVEPGEVVGVVGANGAGKTTLLRAGLGLIHLEAGRAALAGRDVHHLSEAERAALVSYLPQERRVGWNLPAWRVASLGAPNLPPKEARARARAALHRVGLGPLEDRGVLDMSGGERA